MTDVQRSILARKIAAADARAATEDPRAVEAGNIAARLLNDYFRINSKPAPLRRRMLDRSWLQTSSFRGCWYHFRSGDADFLVALDNGLVTAAVDAALCRPSKECKPLLATRIERSISAVLARRLAECAATLAGAPGGAEIHLVAVADAPADLEIAKDAGALEVFHQIGFPLTASLHVDFLYAIATAAATALTSESARSGIWGDALDAIARRIPIALKVELGRAELTIEEALSLSPNQQFPLSSSTLGTARMATKDGATTIGAFRLGSHEGVRAVKLA
jgi:hypothetical protein